MLRVYHSNRLDVLEALMEFIVERERLDDPFEPEMVLVQSTGMAQWLQSVIVTLESVNRNVPVGSEFAVKALKTAVANASSAYEGATKVVKQVSETAQANADQAAAATVEAVSKTTSATVSMIKRAA